MTFVPQYTNNLGRQRFVENLNYYRAVTLIVVRDGTLFDVLASTFAYSLDVANKSCLLGECDFVMMSLLSEDPDLLKQ